MKVRQASRETEKDAERIDPTVAPLLLDAQDTAGLLSVGLSTLYAMDRSGELGPQGVRLRRRRLWPREELAAWVRAGCPRREQWAAMSNENFGKGA